MSTEKDYKKLYRSRDNKFIAGVCGGLGDYLNADPTWVRVAFVVLLLAFGATIFIYVLLWIIVPVEPKLPRTIEEPSTTSQEPPDTDAKG